MMEQEVASMKASAEKDLAEAELMRVEANRLSAEGLKEGKHTTEFFVTIVMMVLAKIVLAYGLYKGSEPIIGVGGIMGSLAGGAYAMSRGKAKAGQ